MINSGHEVLAYQHQRELIATAAQVRNGRRARRGALHHERRGGARLGLTRRATAWITQLVRTRRQPQGAVAPTNAAITTNGDRPAPDAPSTGPRTRSTDDRVLVGC